MNNPRYSNNIREAGVLQSTCLSPEAIARTDHVRFRLRTLLILVTIIAALAAWARHHSGQFEVVSIVVVGASNIPSLPENEIITISQFLEITESTRVHDAAVELLSPTISREEFTKAMKSNLEWPPTTYAVSPSWQSLPVPGSWVVFRAKGNRYAGDQSVKLAKIVNAIVDASLAEVAQVNRIKKGLCLKRLRCRERDLMLDENSNIELLKKVRCEIFRLELECANTQVNKCEAATVLEHDNVWPFSFPREARGR